MRAGRRISVGAIAAALSAASLSAAAQQPGARYLSYRSFRAEPVTTRQFADMGCRTRCFMAGNTANSVGKPYCDYPPIWTGPGEYDFAAFDAQVADLVKASPAADFICIVDLNTPPWLARRLSADSFSDLTHLVCDPRWYEQTDAWLAAFLDYAERRHGARIRAYLLSGGGTSEWYEWDFGRRSEKKDAAWVAWQRTHGRAYGKAAPSRADLAEAAFEGTIYDPSTEREKIDYWRFHNSLPADAVTHFAAEARRHLPKEKEIGVFFGYYHVREELQVSFGHLDYLRVFDSPDIDFIVAPGIYKERACGGPSGTQTVIGSARLRGKRFLHEIDFWPHDLVAPWGSSKTYFKTEADDIAGNLREAAFALANNASLWWFDQLGGFYRNPVLRERIAAFCRAAEKTPDAPSLADVLLVADPESFYSVNERSPQAAGFGQAFYRALNKSGFASDVHSFDDLARIDLSRYKVVCLPCTFLVTPARAEFLRRRVCTGGRTVLWSYAPGISDGEGLDVRRVRDWAGVDFGTDGVSTTDRGTWRAVYAKDPAAFTPEVLFGVCRAAGAHAYLDGPATVFANERVLAVHVRDGGRRRVRLPWACRRAEDLLTGRVLGENTASFELEFRSPDTVIIGLER